MSKFGWCFAPIKDTKSHKGCRKQFEMDGKIYTCDCKCHKEKNVGSKSKA
jgi:hypothetical protein